MEGQPRLYFTVVDAVSQAYQRIRATDFDAEYFDCALLNDPFRGHVQRVGLLGVDFALRDIFTDKKLLGPLNGASEPDLTPDELVNYLVHCIRCGERAKEGRHPFKIEAEQMYAYYLRRSDELLAGLTRSKRDRIVKKFEARDHKLLAQ